MSTSTVFQTDRPLLEILTRRRIWLCFLGQRISVSTSAKWRIWEGLLAFQAQLASPFRGSDCRSHTGCSEATQTLSFHWGRPSSLFSYFCNSSRGRVLGFFPCQIKRLHILSSSLLCSWGVCPRNTCKNRLLKARIPLQQVNQPRGVRNYPARSANAVAGCLTRAACGDESGWGEREL